MTRHKDSLKTQDDVMRLFFRKKLRDYEEIIDNSDLTIANELGLKLATVHSIIARNLKRKYKHLEIFIMKTATIQINFTITRTNHKGLMEWLTEKGWRSENAISENQLKKLYFNNEDGSKKVKELKADCRLPAMKKSIILNYSYILNYS